ncbi:MAG TPA: DinB family protein [Blastocatellia bacterium]|nr:DinB family protein [Blastocatellia bacterium]
MNPYAKYLGDREPIAVLAETPQRIRAEIARLGADAFARTYEEGKWTVAQILTHLVQCEIGFSQRIRQALTVENYVAQPFDQDDWMRVETVIDGPLACETFCALRQFDLLLFLSLSPDQRAIALTNPERGPQTVGLLLAIMAGHDLNHLTHLGSIA